MKTLFLLSLSLFTAQVSFADFGDINHRNAFAIAKIREALPLLKYHGVRDNGMPCAVDVSSSMGFNGAGAFMYISGTTQMYPDTPGLWHATGYWQLTEGQMELLNFEYKDGILTAYSRFFPHMCNIRGLGYWEGTLKVQINQETGNPEAVQIEEKMWEETSNFVSTRTFYCGK